MAESQSERRPAVWNTTPLPHVRRVIAVASGKGGVGKSTITVNLAHALTEQGFHVGILDADIYGPSIPRMLKLDTYLKPEVKDGHMVPPVSYGIKALSMALLTGDQAAVLRGPMISKALQQLLRVTWWGTAEKPLDVLLIDMPPGTGDIALSLVQQVPLSGAIIITTPQDIAVADADKAAEMFGKVGVPVIGIIENMSYFADPAGGRHVLFGAGGGEKLAKKYRVSLLGQLPLDPVMGEQADKGENYLEGKGEAASAYRQLVKALAASF